MIGFFCVSMIILYRFRSFKYHRYCSAKDHASFCVSNHKKRYFGASKSKATFSAKLLHYQFAEEGKSLPKTDLFQQVF